MAILQRYCMVCGESMGAMSLTDFRETNELCDDCNASNTMEQHYHVLWYGGVMHNDWVQ